ncbi:16673_t:CDS:10 [Dentiscutata erythropus]|uniref:16673_t:CDS:1 n=1 Tax=Dentiscutata erythropus TaxID=1348616 RepID=A0A9N8WDI4_9GLOM|nr:16673_t:CDS:10 [Dentiscutata erythropus]
MESQLFTECHYSRFSSGGRTNIYGLALFETSMESGLPVDSEFPSNIIKSFPQNISHKPQSQNKSNAIKHLFVSSFYGITCFVSATGYWNTIELPINQDIGEIVSMDAFPSDQSNLIFTLTTTEGDGQHNFTLRIYSLDDASQMYMEEAIFRIAEQCQVIRIPFTPMQLFHTGININGKLNTCLLLCGNDGGVHLYLRNKSTNKWEEEPVRSYFPLLASLSESSSSILSLEIREIGDLKIVAAGCQNGRLYVSIMKYDSSVGDFVPMDEPAFVVLFSPITSISVFSSSSSKVSSGDIHMLVTCAVERAIIYCNVDKVSLNRPVYLKECSQYDSVLCSNIMDVDWDGNNEIIIGTYGRELLVYKQGLSFSHPIYQIANLDLNQDGIEELIVATQYGIHILQPNLEKAKTELLKVLEDLKSLKNELKELKEEQSS